MGTINYKTSDYITMEDDKMKTTEFHGTLKFTPKYAKCGPIYVDGHWTLRDTGLSFRVWCNEGLYKNGINETICEIFDIKENPCTCY